MLHVLTMVEPTEAARPSGEPEYTWTGLTVDGWSLTVIAVDLGERLLIIHVMPEYRKE